MLPTEELLMLVNVTYGLEGEKDLEINVKLQAFEGPLDLLLHLIDKNKVDIYDIPIVEITDEYMEYVRAMDNSDLDVMSEFLLMATTLLDIKSRMLLPREEKEEEDVEEEDPRAELVQQLLEYKMARQLSMELKDRQMTAAQVLFRTKKILPDEVKDYEAPVDYDELRGDMTLPKLHEIFKAMLMRQEDRIDPIRSRYGNIEKDEIDMDAKTLFVKAFAMEHKTFSFRKLLEKQRSRAELIVTFLIVLELMKSGDISVFQETIDDDILITSNLADKPVEEVHAEEVSEGIEN